MGSILRSACYIALLLAAGQACLRADFIETDLVSDLPGRAAFLDSKLVNPWGIALSSSSPFWVADNGTGVSTIYDGSGKALPLSVTVPTASGGTPPSTPTGIVSYSGSGFEVGPGAPSRFIFATEDGTISGWNPGAAQTTALREVDNGANGAVFKGLAVGNNGSADFLYAANFGAGTIDVFDSTFKQATLSGNFTDPTLPSGYAPFNIRNFGDKLYVTYAVRESGGADDVPGPGNGIVDVFDLNGNFVRRLISGGALNSPWGLAIADSAFGPYGNMLLVGNFGDGRINMFDPTTGSPVGPLRDANGIPFEIDGLWGLTFGNGGNGGSTHALYFTAGLSAESHGLFGRIAAVPEGRLPTGWLLGVAMVGLAFCRRQLA